MIDLNEKNLEVIDRRDKPEPRFSDIVDIFKLLVSQLPEASRLLEVIIKNQDKISLS